MVEVKSYTLNNISHYRTKNYFKRYGEIYSIDEFIEYCEWAQKNHVDLYIVGNGSNTFFAKKTVNTLVIKNNLQKYIKPLSELRIEVSSSVMVSEVLKYCAKNSLDSFYYLASVPATIGGALAMNAGRGKDYGVTIYDFVESVTFFEDGHIKTLAVNEIERTYRETIFTGIHSRLILSTILKFEKKEFEDNPVVERREWAKEHQDNVGPNCGSVFKFSYIPILNMLKGLAFGKACYSAKTSNWILNKSSDPKNIVILITIAKSLHFIVGRKAILEIIVVK